MVSPSLRGGRGGGCWGTADEEGLWTKRMLGLDSMGGRETCFLTVDLAFWAAATTGLLEVVASAVSGCEDEDAVPLWESLVGLWAMPSECQIDNGFFTRDQWREDGRW